MEMPITSSAWTFVTHRLQEPFWPPRQDGYCLLQLPKFGVNLVYKAIIVVAMLVTLVATPCLLAADCLCPSSHVAEGAKNPARTMQALTILDFYGEGGRNDRGATLEDIWSWDDRTLEQKHDFIQWLFPLKRKGVNPTAALTDQKTMQAFRSDPALQAKMRKSFDVMLKFYGLTRTGLAPDFNAKAQNWLNAGNHNYLRLTRMITSLRLHGLNQEAQDLYNVLQGVYRSHSHQIGQKTFQIWQSAAS